MIIENDVELQFFSKIQERDIQFLLMQEFACCPAIAKFLLRKSEEDIVVTKVWHSKTETTYSGDKESDLVIFYKENNKDKFVLVEIKIDAPASGDNQGKAYQERVKYYQKKYNATGYSLLLAPENYSGKKDYDDIVSFDEMITFYENHYANKGDKTDSREIFVANMLKEAIRKNENPEKLPKDEAIVDFYNNYYSFIREYNSQNDAMLAVSSSEYKYRDLGTERAVMFSTKYETVRIIHNFSSGLIQLQFMHAKKIGCVEQLVEYVTSQVDYPSLYLKPDYKSNGKDRFSFVCIEDKLHIKKQFGEQVAIVEKCFERIWKLVLFANGLDRDHVRLYTEL